MVKGSDVAIVVECFSMSVEIGREVVGVREEWLVKVSVVKDIPLSEGDVEGIVTEVLVVILVFDNVVGKLVDDCVFVSVDSGWEVRSVEVSSVTVEAVGTDDNVLADLVEEVINGVVDL